MQTFLENLPLAKDKLLGMTEEERLTVAIATQKRGHCLNRSQSNGRFRLADSIGRCNTSSLAIKRRMLPMKYRTRIYYTEAQKILMWNRWQKGESLSSIARLFDRHHSSVEGILKQTGGIRPRLRRRSRLALTLSDREDISRGVVAGGSIRSIAVTLGRAPSTVSREIGRNGGRLRYRANRADQAAWERARRPKTCKLVQKRELAHSVALNLKKLWSPEQIDGWLKRTYPDHKDFQVSDETIYKSLFIQARGALKKELLQHWRRRRGMRRSRHHTQKTEDHGRIKDPGLVTDPGPGTSTGSTAARRSSWSGLLSCYFRNLIWSRQSCSSMGAIVPIR